MTTAMPDRPAVGTAKPREERIAKRLLGKTNWPVTPIGLGTWSMGGAWGATDDVTSRKALQVALAEGVDFFDTADNYGDGHSEVLLGEAVCSLGGAKRYVATKMGRRASADEYTLDNFRRWTDASRERLGVSTIDLVQLHCPPAEVYSRPAVFEALDQLVVEGRARHYGVSVQSVAQGLQALSYEGVATLQVVFNIFRQRPAQELFPTAQAAGVGVIARIPLASGLLSGKLTRDTAFSNDDHRFFNRHGEVFDVGETFAGVDYELGLKAAEQLRGAVPKGMTMAQFALRWALMFEAVSVVIVGARKPEHVREAARVTNLPPLAESAMATATDVYSWMIAPHVGNRW